jgi:hypothetical protein
MRDDPSITPAEMLHNLHAAGYDRQESVLAVKRFFPDVTADEMCRIIVNEYTSPLIEKGELRRLLLLCEYDSMDVDEAIERYYPRSLGYILMLDDSNSMHNASAMIKIDAKAFLDSSRLGDQFGVNIFAESSAWLYPSGSDPGPAVVTESRSELAAAKAEIDLLKTGGNWTNIGAAIGLGNSMFEKLAADIKAFVLISDGDYNTGVNPAGVLKNEPPVYIAGLGPYMKESYFAAMLAKNTKSKFYNSPNAYDMMAIFNQILADSSQSLLALDNKSIYSGTNYSINEFSVYGQGNRSLLSVVWSDKKYQYTPGYPGGNLINLILIDPDNRKTPFKPWIAEAGFCIFDLRNLRPGKWKLLTQYSVDEPVSATAGVIQAGACAGVEITGAQSARAGETPGFMLHITGNRDALKNVTISTVYSKPAVCVKKLIARLREEGGLNISETENGQWENLLLKNRARFSRIHTLGTLSVDKKGMCFGTMEPVDNTGIYNADLVIRGEYADTGFPFVCHKKHAVIVE